MSRYLLDSNIFLEVELGQERAEACSKTLRRFLTAEMEGVVTDFSVDTIVIVMENYGKGWDEIRRFLSSLLAYKGLHVYFCTLLDRVRATTHMRDHGLDFDDALTLEAMRANGMEEIISYDGDFDPVPKVRRVEPEVLVG